MGTGGAQAGGLWPSWRLLALAAGTFVASVAATATFSVTTSPATVVAVTATATTTTSIVTVTASTTATALRREYLGDQGFVAAAAEHLERLGLLASTLGSENGGDGKAIEVGIGLHLHDVADRGAGREQASVERALGLLGSGCTPGPLPVAAVGGEFDIKPSCHGGNGIGP